MIQLRSIRIEEFRGIREMQLDLQQDSFVVLGPNGSGKSGVVDAIDFALTGSVARLSGAGSGGVSLLKHGPHVHKRDDPATARVALTICDSASGQIAVLSRCVKTPGQYILEPSTPELVAAVQWAAQHPELTLSRREVIKYVNTEPGKRAQEVQALLKLDRIDETRRLLRSALTKTSTEANRTASDATAAEDKVRRHLDLSALLSTEVAAAVNRHRATLGLDPLVSLTPETELNVGANSTPERAGYNKVSALRDLDALAQYLTNHAELSGAAAELTGGLAELEADPTILEALKHRRLVEIGLPLVADAQCPLCDQVWQGSDELRTPSGEQTRPIDGRSGVKPPDRAGSGGCRRRSETCSCAHPDRPASRNHSRSKC